MPYAIRKSSAHPSGGFLNASNEEWMAQSFADGTGVVQSNIFRGYRTLELNVDKAPQYLIVEKPKPILPDMFWSMAGLLVISGAYHDIIEQLDPGLHQTWPMEIRRKRKGPYPGRWFGLNIRPRAKAITKEGSDTRPILSSDPNDTRHRLQLAMSHRACIKRTALPDVHLWWDDGLDDHTIVCSDTLRDAVVDAGLKSIPFVKCKVSDD